MKVVAEGLSYGAYLKPGQKKNDNTARAANEKICADLAQDVSAPVPPALLYDREPAGASEEENTVLSLFLSNSEQVWTLQDFQDIPEPPDVIDKALENSSSVVPFDIWVGNTDTDTRNTLIINDSTGGYRAVHIDLAYALNKKNRWESGSSNNVSAPNYKDRVRDNLDKQEVMSAVERIENLPEETIREVVQRIPDRYMSTSERNLVVEGLVQRRVEVRSVAKSLV